MIIDTHTHYCEPHSVDRPYDLGLVHGNPELAAAGDVLVNELIARAVQAGVDKVVQVTKTKMGYDNCYSLEGASQYPERVLGLVGRFDPMQMDLEHKLAVYMSDPHMPGVRITLLTAQTTPWLRDRKLDAFFSAAQELNVLVQILAPNQTRELRDTARRFPGIRFLVDHMALNNEPPGPIEKVFRNWTNVIALAEEPNVWMKVSFFPEAAYASEKFPFPTAQRRFQELYDNVGARPLIWGSNFPPVSKACSYKEAVDFVRVHCEFLPTADREAILGKNFTQYLMRH